MSLSVRSSESETKSLTIAIWTADSTWSSWSGNSMTGKGLNEAEEEEEDDDERRGRWPRALRIWRNKTQLKENYIILKTKRRRPETKSRHMKVIAPWAWKAASKREFSKLSELPYLADRGGGGGDLRRWSGNREATRLRRNDWERDRDKQRTKEAAEE